MTAQVTGDDPERCDECGSRHCVLRPIQLESGDVRLVCGSCFLDLDRDHGVDRVDWRPGPTPRSTGVETWNPAGSEFGLLDPENPRAYLHAENAVDLEVWR